MPERLVICPDCGGDGKETCHNPDHGFVEALSFHEVGRLGCPVCGHDQFHKVPNGTNCETCNGEGLISEQKARTFCDIMEYDYDDIMDTIAND